MNIVNKALLYYKQMIKSFSSVISRHERLTSSCQRSDPNSCYCQREYYTWVRFSEAFMVVISQHNRPNPTPQLITALPSAILKTFTLSCCDKSALSDAY